MAHQWVQAASAAALEGDLTIAAAASEGAEDFEAGEATAAEVALVMVHRMELPQVHEAAMAAVMDLTVAAAAAAGVEATAAVAVADTTTVALVTPTTSLCLHAAVATVIGMAAVVGTLGRSGRTREVRMTSPDREEGFETSKTMRRW